MSRDAGSRPWPEQQLLFLSVKEEHWLSWLHRAGGKWKWKSLSRVWLSLQHHGLYSPQPNLLPFSALTPRSTNCHGRLVAKLCPPLATLWTVAFGLLCPWGSPGKNTGVCCRFLLQGIFPTQGLNLGLLHCSWILHSLSHQGSFRLTGSSTNTLFCGEVKIIFSVGFSPPDHPLPWWVLSRLCRWGWRRAFVARATESWLLSTVSCPVILSKYKLLCAAAASLAKLWWSV